MARIKQQVKEIADAHINARKIGQFDNPQVKTADEVLAALKSGKTFEEVIRQIEIRYCSIGSILLSNQLNYTSQAYKKSVYKGFKVLLQGY